MTRTIKFIAVFAALCVLTLCPAPYSAAATPADGRVYMASLDGVIGVPLEDFTDIVFAKPESNDVLILKINTPGGLVDSMSELTVKIAAADFPVVAWVAPGGARAASAGAFIVEASHVAAMAPGTNMGAAHPVGPVGRDLGNEESGRKVVNDLAAKMRSFAEERGRDVAAAESMVRESVSFTAREALEKKLIDVIAADADELLASLDGMEVKVHGEPVTLKTAGKSAERLEMPLRLKLLEIFSRPDIAYLALLAGIMLIVIEVKTPGGYVLGTVGAVLLVAASYGLRVLPVNLAGVILLAGGIAIVILDVLIGGMGLVSIAGICSMLFGGLIMFRAPGGELLRVSPVFMIVSTLIVAAAAFAIITVALKALRSRPTSGQEGMVGEKGEVKSCDGGKCTALIFGEYWRVIPDDPAETLAAGDRVEVVRVESLVLYVKKTASEGAREA